MIVTVTDEQIGKIEYEESGFGRITLRVGGVPLQKKDKSTFVLPDGTDAVLKGCFLTGATLNVKGRPILISGKPKWYEIVIAFAPVAFVIAWGASPTLVQIFPMIGGAIGGAVSALIGASALACMKSCKKTALKIGLGILIAALNVGACALIGFGVLSAASRVAGVL